MVRIVKTFYRLLSVLLITTFCFQSPVSAQDQELDSGWVPVTLPNELTNEEDRAFIDSEVAKNISRLAAEGIFSANAQNAVSFIFPLRAAENLHDASFYGVSGYMDHDPDYGDLVDYMCGNRTYDLSSGYDHQGTDYFTYPFAWYKMDNQQVEIIAAAAGTIVFKRDGQFDRQCAMTGALSNAVVLRHADGTMTHYLHMKQGSVTNKAVGDTVATGEYLGIVGSSGSSTGPHLHFEVRSPSNSVIDPFEGPCNALPSMWESQAPYYDSAIIAVHTGSNRPYYPSTPCGEQENTNLQSTFEPDDVVYFVTYYRDLLEGQESIFRIRKPDGSIYQTWSVNSTNDHYTVAYRYWAKSLDADGPVPNGNWQFEVDFEEQTYTTEFYVGGPMTVTVKSPNGSEKWKPGTFRGIAWDTNLEGDTSEFWLDLYKDNIFHSRIYTATPSAGFYFWGIPQDLPPGADYRVQIMDSEHAGVVDRSDEPFVIAPVPKAGFTYSPITGTAPLTVTFVDTSTSLIDTWLWSFGDGGSSTLQHPMHTYLATGVYTVALAVNGPTGSSVVTRTRAVTMTPPAPTAAFSGHPTLGTAPLTVTFQDTSSGPPIDSWFWSFGDGVTSTLQHSSHVYTQTGSYAVTLKVIAGLEQDVITRSAYIRVAEQIHNTYLPVIIR